MYVVEESIKAQGVDSWKGDCDAYKKVNFTCSGEEEEEKWPN